MKFVAQQWSYVISTVFSENHMSWAVQYALKFVDKLLDAASQKAVAVV